jgi:hypothetical protein
MFHVKQCVGQTRPHRTKASGSQKSFINGRDR